MFLLNPRSSREREEVHPEVHTTETTSAYCVMMCRHQSAGRITTRCCKAVRSFGNVTKLKYVRASRNCIQEENKDVLNTENSSCHEVSLLSTNLNTFPVICRLLVAVFGRNSVVLYAGARRPCNGCKRRLHLQIK
jgi:hypothetical protein